ncbi:hypothetical protein C1Y11_24055 [Pseudomonas sp. FW305-20]|nr:hypothetical protein C1Y11_24055 [Pseudomonas sp. FW305-20]PMU19472.1 hypothetical protein C1Y10_09660 [Pseudomonas sp. FW305-122]PMU35533.1 hypothetical protein C1Y12_25195 [Pseudomonas sp. FW305-47B]PMX57508.1 hypothetical protein C1Y13_24205 [Pseudomonas sp. FW305-33]PMX69466.1 hypothetical protein C1X12_08005 [Pseudomonas sp. FW305-60]
MIVPTRRVGMPQWTPRVRFGRDAERPGLHSHAERGNDQSCLSASTIKSMNTRVLAGINVRLG